MNRLTAAFAPPRSYSSTVSRAAHTQTATRHDPAYCVMAPLHYEAGYAYPLLVWLHGPGRDERELKRIMKLVSLRNYVSLAVRGSAEEADGYDWPQTAPSILDAEQSVLEAVSEVRARFHVHPARVFLAGQESGGTMAIRIALRNPDRLAGAASLGGPFPEGHAPLARLPQARGSRLLIAHCRDSLVYPLDRVCEELSLFHAAGMSVTLREYPCAEGLTTLMLRDLNVWLMQQVTGDTTVNESQPAALPSEWN